MSTPPEKSFKSFRDLARARGSEPPEHGNGEPEDGGRGWTLEDEEGEAAAAALADSDVATDGVRLRIDRRPPATGAMEWRRRSPSTGSASRRRGASPAATSAA